MKIRSALLIACLIVVPLLAMVSHKIPAATRVAIRECLWDPIIAAIGLGSPAPPRPSPRLSSPLPPSADPGVAAANALPGPAATLAGAGPAAADIAPPTAVRGGPLEPPTVPLVREPDPGITATALPPAILRGADDSLPIGGETGRESLEARLRALGATRIDWTPGQGGDGLHRCSCRIPAEPTGQLHRVFQAAAADPVAALDNLVGQVTAWSMRTGGTAAGPSTPLLR
jgi:hypothetical protein